MNDIKEKTVWKFKYKDVHCEIVNWGKVEMASVSEGGIWNGYIIFYKQEIGYKKFRKLLCKERSSKWTTITRKYWDYSKIDNMFDMHGGVTYYELLRNQFDGKPMGVKIGCDYAHSFDEGHYIELNEVKRDLEETVDKLSNLA